MKIFKTKPKPKSVQQKIELVGQKKYTEMNLTRHCTKPDVRRQIVVLRLVLNHDAAGRVIAIMLASFFDIN